ncbi:MAG TPA: hypothetical protein PLK12_15470 [Prolixibacteraceae bacterium]|nr:hypothetical protein [Prolixibacteraceae bacterium]
MNQKNKTSWMGIALSAVLVLFVHTGFSGESMTITIDVAPAVLNIQNQGEVVTIHTDISYYLVAASSVSLNGIEIDSWKSDDRGNFVAKFLMEEVKDLPLNIDDYNTLTLTGTTINGESFTGSEEIRVINVIPKGKK